MYERPELDNLTTPLTWLTCSRSIGHIIKLMIYMWNTLFIHKKCVWMFNISLAVSNSGVARMSKLREYSMGTLCACITHICMLGDQGHAPAMKIFVNYILWDRLFVATNTILSILPVCYMKLTITHANNWSLTFTLFLPGHRQILCGHRLRYA